MKLQVHIPDFLAGSIRPYSKNSRSLLVAYALKRLLESRDESDRTFLQVLKGSCRAAAHDGDALSSVAAVEEQGGMLDSRETGASESARQNGLREESELPETASKNMKGIVGGLVDDED